MEQEIVIKGGFSLNYKRERYPLVNLIVTKEELIVKTKAYGIYKFLPENILEIEPVFFFPFLGQGIQITGKNDQYGDSIYFWSFRNPWKLIRQIREIGFLSS